MIVMLIIIGIFIWMTYQHNAKGKNPGNSSQAASQNYKKRLSMYKNAIEQNRYHSISKIALDYHLPAHIIIQDILKLQEEGYLQNVKVTYNHDEITYLDEENQVRKKLDAAKEQQISVSRQTKAYADTRKVSPVNVQNKGPEKKVVQTAKPITAEKKQQEKHAKSDDKIETIHVEVAQGVQSPPAAGVAPRYEEPQTEYMYEADYSVEEPEYNYVAEYPDVSGLWDDVHIELFPESNDMMCCDKCGTENIIVRDSQGKCSCYYCQEELV